MEIHELNITDSPLWDEFVNNSTWSTIFQLSGWQEINQRVFGCRTHYLYAQRGATLVGILPLLEIKRPLTGHYFLSMSGGLCADDQEAANALIEEAIHRVKSSGAKYLWLRDSYQDWEHPGLVKNTNHCTFRVDLAPDPEQVWQRINPNSRRLLRKAASAGIECHSKSNQLEVFYPIYLQAMRDRGTPPFGKRFFQNLLTKYSPYFVLQIAQRNNKILAAGYIVVFKDTLSCIWAAIPTKSVEFHPGYSLFWEALRFGIEKNLRWVDFGRSRLYSGSYNFKLSFGAKVQPLYQLFYLNGIQNPPPVGGDIEEDSAYHFFLKVWKKLPLWMTAFLGSYFRKSKPYG